MKTILIVDDQYVNRLLFKTILSSEKLTNNINYNIVEAVNGQESVDLVNEINVDLIIMDINMPVMNGIAATKIIKEIKPNLPIIGISAFDAVSIKDSYGFDVNDFDKFMTKPVDMVTLNTIVAKLI